MKDSYEISRDFYNSYYEQLFSKHPIISRMKSFTHRSLERGFQKRFFDNVLEIGAGSGEHFPFVKHNFRHYTMLDFTTERLSKFQGDNRVSLVADDFISHDFGIQKFDRIIMTCVLHHINNPFEALSKVRSILENDGIFSLFLPCDPGLLNRINRRLILFPVSRSLGIVNYPLINAIEHKNHVWGLHEILTEIFTNFEISKRYYPFGLKSFNLNTFMILQIRKRFAP